MDDTFYRGPDSEKQLIAVAYRAAESLLRSVNYLTPAITAELLGLFNLHTLWGLCLVLAGWFLATVISGPIGIAINVALLVYGLWDLWDRVRELYALLKDWFWGFYNATNDKELDEAGQHFATAISKGGITILELVLTHRAFRFASGKMVERFPPPEKLKTRVQAERERASKSEEQRSKTESERKTETDRRTESEQRDAERKRTEETPKERRVAQRLAELRGDRAGVWRSGAGQGRGCQAAQSAQHRNLSAHRTGRARWRHSCGAACSGSE
jgi:hypothetical protein